MAKIISQGCVATCGACKTKFSFTPSEAQYRTQRVEAGYSPEEEAYDADVFTVACPHCGHGVDVTRHIGSEALKTARELRRAFRDYDD